jgi:hypothetical protein
MPMIDFQCLACGSKFEHFYHVSEAGEIEAADCETEGCIGIAPRIYEYKRPHSYTGLIDPIVVHMAPDGHYSIPGHKDERVPDGFTRVEIRDAAHARRVEAAMNDSARREWERTNEGKQRLQEMNQQHFRRELRTAMEQGRYVEDPDGSRRFVGPMRPVLRDFARFAMQRNDQKPADRFRGETYFEALAFNAGNRAEHRDEKTGWKARK